MFADDLKIFCRVKSILDATNLRDLDTLSSWCQRNCLALNINKCKTMSFYRNRSPIYFNYEIQNTHLMSTRNKRSWYYYYYLTGGKTLKFFLCLMF